MNQQNPAQTAVNVDEEKKRVIFCDFDGTITESDNIVAIMKHFNPEGWQDIVKEIVDKRTTLREGVERMFAMLPASMKDEVIDYAISNAVLRKGLPELLSYCREQQIEFYVTSGGIDFFIYPLLSDFDIPKEHIYCNGSDFSGSEIKILWPHRCDEHCQTDCGMCKTSIIRSFSKERYQRILIGDSISDFEGAKLADLVFARSHLVDLCQQLNLPYHSFEDFHDVIRQLEVCRIS